MRKVEWWLLLVFVFAIPWQYSLDLGAPLGNVARIAGLAAMVLAVAASLRQGAIRSFGALQWLVMALFLWSCCTYFWSIEQGITLTRVRAYMQEMMTVWLLWEFAETAHDLRALLRAYVAGCWVAAILTVAGFASAGVAGQIRFAAAGHDPNDLSRLLDLGFPMAALLFDWEEGWRWRAPAVAFLPVGLFAVLLTGSREGFVAALVAFAGCGWLFLRNRPRGRVFSIFVLLGVAAASWYLVPRATAERLATVLQELTSGDLNQRLDIWQAGWQAFGQSPMVGAGAGSFVAAADLAGADTAHNTALSLAVEGGIIALLIASAIVAVTVGALRRLSHPVRIALGASFLVWLLTSMVATVEQNRSTWFLLALISVAERIMTEVANPEIENRRQAPSPKVIAAGEIAGF